IVFPPAASVEIGAVSKLVVNGYGAPTMKVAYGTGKATLPGELQVWRFADHDLVALAREPRPGSAAAGAPAPMLVPVWRDDGPVHETSAPAALADARAR